MIKCTDNGYVWDPQSVAGTVFIFLHTLTMIASAIQVERWTFNEAWSELCSHELLGSLHELLLSQDFAEHHLLEGRELVLEEGWQCDTVGLWRVQVLLPGDSISGVLEALDEVRKGG